MTCVGLLRASCDAVILGQWAYCVIFAAKFPPLNLATFDFLRKWSQAGKSDYVKPSNTGRAAQRCILTIDLSQRKGLSTSESARATSTERFLLFCQFFLVTYLRMKMSGFSLQATDPSLTCLTPSLSRAPVTQTGR